MPARRATRISPNLLWIVFATCRRHLLLFTPHDRTRISHSQGDTLSTSIFDAEGSPGIKDEDNPETDPAWLPLVNTLQSRLDVAGYGTTIDLSSIDPHRWQTTLSITVTGNAKLQCEVFGLHTPWTEPEARAAHIDELAERGWKHVKAHNSFKLQKLKIEVAEFVRAVIAALRDDLGITSPDDLTVHASGARLYPSDSDSTSVMDTLNLRREDICAIPERALDTIERLIRIDFYVPVVEPAHYLSSSYSSPHYRDSQYDYRESAPIAFLPNGASQLTSLACSTLSRMTGQSIRDVTGGMPFLPFPGPHISRLFVTHDAEQLVFCMPIAHHFRDPQLLGTATLSFSSTWPTINLVVVGDHLYAVRVLDCKIFHEANMQVAVREWFSFCENAATSLAETMNPDACGSDLCIPKALPRKLQELMEADVKASSGLKPSRVLTQQSLSHIQATSYRRLCRRLTHEWTSSSAPTSMTDRPDHAAATAYLTNIADLFDAALPMSKGRDVPDDPYTPDGPHTPDYYA